MTAMAEQMTQLNMRVNAQDKRQAEEVLRFMGSTTTELVRKLLAKIASGAKAYMEICEVLETPASAASAEQEGLGFNPVISEATEICNAFAQMLGYESAADLPKDNRSYDELYEEAMLEHYREKGWLS